MIYIPEIPTLIDNVDLTKIFQPDKLKPADYTAIVELNSARQIFKRVCEEIIGLSATAPVDVERYDAEVQKLFVSQLHSVQSPIFRLILMTLA